VEKFDSFSKSRIKSGNLFTTYYQQMHNIFNV
jgi:hypothetical protein